MKNRCLSVWLLSLFSFLSLALFPASSAESASATSTKQPKYILFLTADGFRTDYIEWYNPPNLKQLIADGVRVIHATNVFPAVTAPNMTSLVTGAYPRTTGIGVNSQYVKEEDRIVQHPRKNQAETIAETLKKAGWKTAAVNHFMLENRGATLYEAPGYDNTEKTADAVLDLLTNKNAHFIAAIFGATDHAGHSFGPQSDQVKAAVADIDAAVGRIVQVLKDKGIYDQTLIAFTADHGMSGYESKEVSISPARALRAAGFRTTTPEGDLKPDTQIIIIAAGVQVINFRPSVTPEQKEKAVAALSKIQGVEVLDRKQLDALGCHDSHSGDVIVSPLPGYTMSNAGKSGGLHGRFTEQNPILIFHGPGFAHGTVEAAHTVDVVPTLLHLVGVPPAKTVDGAVITQALTH